MGGYDGWSSPSQDPSLTPNPEVASETFSFFTLLSTLDGIPLLSLRALNFRHVSLKFDKDEDEISSSGSPLPTALSKVRFLTFESPKSNPLAFENVVHATRFFPFLERLSAHGTTGNQHRNGILYPLSPPTSLWWLCVDTPTFLRMMEWLTAFEPKHTTISMLSIYDSTVDHTEQEVVSRLSSALHRLGPSLEEFELILSSTRYFHEHAFVFMNNTSLEKVHIRGELPLLAQFLPRLFDIISSVPHLEELQFYIDPWPEDYFPLLMGFFFLDKFIQSYPSLQRVTFMRQFTSESWDVFNEDMTMHMPRCT